MQPMLKGFISASEAGLLTVTQAYQAAAEGYQCSDGAVEADAAAAFKALARVVTAYSEALLAEPEATE